MHQRGAIGKGMSWLCLVVGAALLCASFCAVAQMAARPGAVAALASSGPERTAAVDSPRGGDSAIPRVQWGTDCGLAEEAAAVPDTESGPAGRRLWLVPSTPDGRLDLEQKRTTALSVAGELRADRSLRARIVAVSPEGAARLARRSARELGEAIAAAGVSARRTAEDVAVEPGADGISLWVELDETLGK